MTLPRWGGMGNNNRLRVLEDIVEVIHLLRPIVAAVAKHDRSLAEQIRRAATSCSLNLSEGNARTAGNRRAHFESALGSARETRTGLHGAVAWGYVAASTVAEADRRLDGVAAQTFKLARA